MLAVSILEDTDTILATDWCRPLLLVTMTGGHSDYYSFENMYSGQPENNVLWVNANQIIGEGWVGGTVAEYNNAMEKFGKQLEFIRGDIPVSHQYGKTRQELIAESDKHLEDTIATIGKYKGKSWSYIKQYDGDYFEWAIRTGLISEFNK